MEWNSPASKVFEYFEELAAIPHGSRNTKAISDYVVAFAHKLGLDCRQDEWNNVVVRKPASIGCESAPTVILQGHLDMVAVVDNGVDFDFMKDALRLVVDGDWLSAEGTTLGADDGAAVAMMMAILADDSLIHPELECVFTSDEEIGMIGATNMDMSDLKGRLMLNMDCDSEGEITASCAGGVRSLITLPTNSCEVEGSLCEIEIEGLLGGHSGVEIHKNHVNAIRLLLSMLQECMPENANLIAIDGGAADNAIPAFAGASFMVSAEQEMDVDEKLEEMAMRLSKQYEVTEPDLEITISWTPDQRAVARTCEANRLIAGTLAMPNGVQSWTVGMEDLVETSLNLGIIHTLDDRITLDLSIRSSVTQRKHDVMDELKCHAAAMHSDISFSSEYPGWPLKVDSPLQNLAKKIWREQTGSDLSVVAIHAGLECGLFSDALPGCDIIAYGPQMYDIHSTKERLSISSTERTYAFTRGLLTELTR